MPNTPLIQHLSTLSDKKDKEILSTLINDKTIDAKGDQGQTALHWAVMKRQPLWIRTLLDRGAKLNIPNADGKTALQLAKETKDQDIILAINNVNPKDESQMFSAMMETIRKKTITDKERYSTLKAQLKQGYDIDYQNAFGKTLLLFMITHFSVNNKKYFFDKEAALPFLKLVLDSGADTTLKNKSGQNLEQFFAVNGTLSHTYWVKDYLNETLNSNNNNHHAQAGNFDPSNQLPAQVAQPVAAAQPLPAAKPSEMAQIKQQLLEQGQLVTEADVGLEKRHEGITKGRQSIESKMLALEELKQSNKGVEERLDLLQNNLVSKENDLQKIKEKRPGISEKLNDVLKIQKRLQELFENQKAIDLDLGLVNEDEPPQAVIPDISGNPLERIDNKANELQMEIEQIKGDLDKVTKTRDENKEKMNEIGLEIKKTTGKITLVQTKMESLVKQKTEAQEKIAELTQRKNVLIEERRKQKSDNEKAIAEMNELIKTIMWEIHAEVQAQPQPQAQQQQEPAQSRKDTGSPKLFSGGHVANDHKRKQAEEVLLKNIEKLGTLLGDDDNDSDNDNSNAKKQRLNHSYNPS